MGCSPYNGIALSHFSSPKSQAGGDDCWKAFRDCSNCQCHGNFEIVDAAGQGELDALPFRKVARLSLPGQEVVVVDQPDKNADDKNHLNYITFISQFCTDS